MGSINRNSMLVAGLAGGVAANLVDMVANGFLSASAWESAMSALGIDYGAMAMSATVLWITIDLVMGVLIAWIYASILVTHGGGTRTGLMAGGVPWLAMSLVFLGFTGMGVLTTNLLGMVLISGLVAALAAGYVVARLYKPA